MASTTKIFFATDLHGSNVCFRKFINAGKFYKADVLIIGGDVTGKALVPIIKSPDGYHRATFGGEERQMESADEVAAFEKVVADTGFYSVRLTPDEHDQLAQDDAHRHEMFVKLICRRVEEWMELADERLDGTGIECFISPGNDDYEEIDPIVRQAERVRMPDLEVVVVADEYEMVSCGKANMTPWNCPRDVPEEQLDTLIGQLAAKVKDPERAIYNLHVPPFGTPLDQAPLLDDDMRPLSGPGGIAVGSVGSTAVRDVIGRHQPMLSLHGHIHESRATVKLGRTLAINPGSEYGEGVLHGAIVNLRKGKVKNFQFTTG
jgi:uncharacterized protein